MKTKILMGIISFIFFIYAINTYAITNEVLEQNEKLEDIPKKEYTGTMYLDQPTFQKTFTKSTDTKIEIEGWAVSNDENSTLQILLDGKSISNPLTRKQRKDVDILISPAYGGTTITPQAGFFTELNTDELTVGNHQIKIQQISPNGECIASCETYINLENVSYQGHMYLENPTYNTNYIKPDDAKIKIEGWAVSNDEKATLRVLLDGNIVTTNLSRKQRKDVDAIITPNYGGVKFTPNAGFGSEIDISQLAQGTHNVRVEEISRFGDIIVAYETRIRITNKKYQGHMYLENPTYNTNYIKPDDAKIKLEGWAVSNDEKATLRVLLDGNIVTTNLPRKQRKDVDTIITPNYGGVKLTPNAGFGSEIDISQLAQGTHNVRVEEISRFGDIIVAYETRIRITNKKYQGHMYLENPTYNTNYIKPDDAKIKLEGWAVSNDEKATLRVLLDGNIVTTNLPRKQRKDVDTIITPNYGGVKLTPNAGFGSEIDISQLTQGIHNVRVEEISRFGDIIVAYETMIRITNKKYQGHMYLENPTYNTNYIKPDDAKIKLEGWAVSNDEKATLRVLLDGNIVTTNLPRKQRKDVDTIITPNYGGVKLTPNAGFGSEIDISQLAQGTHNIRVEEISRFGDIIVAYETMIRITNKKYLGEMCIDGPTFNRVYEIGESIAVNGWAVSQDEYATVEIYVDGNFKAKAERYYRPDVIFYKNKYDGKTLNEGFGKLLSSSQIGAGTHKITVYEKSRYGDIIGGVETQIFIKAPISNNPTTPSKPQTTPPNHTNNPLPTNPPSIVTAGKKGIDVSQFQGTIDWKKVANSEIQYAMIRIGYRGYGTGGFAEDTKFKTNFSSAVANGLKVGIYFYSTAINTQEAKKDAEYVVSILKKYGYQNRVSMPIAMDLELVSGVNTRDKNVSKAMRTNIANTFCQTIASYGYTPMIYACKSFLNDNMNANQLQYDVWVAQYNANCTYKGKYTMWQYTSTGKVPGIQGNVDCNICYKNY